MPIDVIKIATQPFPLKPGETHKDMLIASCDALVLKTIVPDLSVASSIDVYKLDALKENTVISFVEVDDKIEGHKLDKILPKTVQTFAGK